MPSDAHEEWNRIMADGRAELHKSIVGALKELSTIEAGKTATVDSKTGRGYSYKYADIADLVKLTRPVLAEHGLVALTPVHALGDHMACSVVLIHESGNKLEFDPLPFAPGGTAQETGSIITYMRRYALLAALGMAAEDDDGKTGSSSSRSEKPRGQRRCVVCDKPLTGAAVPGGGGFAHPECVEPPAGENPDEAPF